VTRIGASERGKGASFKTPRYRGKAKVDLQEQFIGAGCNIKRWLRLLAQQLTRLTRFDCPKYLACQIRTWDAPLVHRGHGYNAGLVYL
jgi:hypothetical protein